MEPAQEVRLPAAAGRGEDEKRVRVDLAREVFEELGSLKLDPHQRLLSYPEVH
jgi:hypothetical protein